MAGTIAVRPARVDDAEALLAIYRPVVETTAISFELEPPDVETFAGRIATVLEGWAWLVAEVDGQVAGYAYGSAHRPRGAYRSSVETSAYVDPRWHRRGLARTLYEELFPLLEAKGYESAFAGITVPNDASIGFHESLGFRKIGQFPRVGRKFDRFHDVAWLYRPVASPAGR